MKTIYMTAALAVISILSFASCGNAGAENKKEKEMKEIRKVTELNAQEFAAKVYDISAQELTYLGDKPAVVDFYATWCGPCQRIAPIMNELAAEYDGKVVIYKVDIDKDPELAKAFGISSIPAILYIPLDGEPTLTVGSRDKSRFKTEIETILLEKK
ncbi:MAG: thioredoxin [Bacteroidales bacterium]|nr:thioredoxin [Bacteroidales bacterium]